MRLRQLARRLCEASCIPAGDIVRVSLDPTVGREQQSDYRPFHVIPPVEFNRLGTALVAPITQGDNFARFQGFAVPLIGAGTETQGVVLVNAVRSLDLQGRSAKKVERVPEKIIDEVLAWLAAISEN